MNARGNALCTLADVTGLLVANKGRVLTFQGHGKSSIVTLVSKGPIGSIRGWRMRSDTENKSDHHHITFLYGGMRPRSAKIVNNWQPGWIFNQIEEDIFMTGKLTGGSSRGNGETSSSGL